jgi:6-phosphogluconolactonase
MTTSSSSHAREVAPLVRVLSFALLAALLGFGMSPVSAASLVYVGNADSQDISIFRLASSGALTPVDSVAVQRPAQPGRSMVIAVSPNRKFLYAGYLRDPSYAVTTYAIDQKSGKLAAVGTTQLADTLAYLATDHTGRFLLGASYGGNKVLVNAIGANGIVGDTVQIVATLPFAHCILPDPSNRFVFHTSLGGDVIYQQRFDAKTGMLTPNDPPTVSVTAKAGPRFLTFSPNGKFLYAVSELDGSIHVFPYDAATGTLNKETQVATALPTGFDGKPWAADIHVTPDGRLLYTSERTSSTLGAFHVDAKTGALTPIGSTPTVKQPRAIAIDPSGSFLLASSQVTASMASYAIDRVSGKLTLLKEYPVGTNPTWVEIVHLH